MVYKKVMAIARAKKRPLTPSEYTSDLAEELEPVAQPKADTRTRSLPGQSASSNAQRRHLKAYELWSAGHGLLDICIRMRTKENPMREATVM